jgi:TolB-like protein/class 3 adenylate cyclase/Tfp pilus assembly protein PilF
MVDDSKSGAAGEPHSNRRKLRVLGSFRLTDTAGAEAVGLGKLDRALLVYLALSQRPGHPRTTLAKLLWPDRMRALHSLSESLKALRKALGDEGASMLVPKSDPLECRFDALDVDALAFEALVQQGTPEALEQAEALYGGDLLDGMEVKAEAFDRWVGEKRRRLRDLAVDCLCRLVHLRWKAGQLQKALETADNALVLDALCEDAHRMIIDIHLQSGRRPAARKHAQLCEELFQRKNIKVEPETRRLMDQALKGDTEPAVQRRSSSHSSGDAMEHELAAILAADVAGYSRMTVQDEAGTYKRLRAHFEELFEPEIARHHGVIFSTAGDGLLAEFRSIVDAMQCAVVLQRKMRERNVDVPDHQRIEFRMGVNLGDIIKDGKNCVGDGVNKAARLQQIAEPGGIYVSSTVYDHVRQKLPLVFVPLGERRLKNIAEPLSVFRVQVDSVPVGQDTRRLPPPPARRWTWAAAAVAAVAAGAALWPFLGAGPVPALPLPDRPSIAVLPFDSLADDPKWSRLADGLTEDLTMNLSRSRDLFVIARNSAEVYGGKAVDSRQVGRELGIKYLIEGSVQASGERVRVSAKLIDAESRRVLWEYHPRREDEPVDDIFRIQDDVTANIAARLLGNEGALNEAERDRLRRKPPANFSAYDYYLQAMQAKRGFSQQDVEDAKMLFRKALELDPGLARAYVGLAWISELEISLGYTTSVRQSLESKRENAAHAIMLDSNDGEAHAALATYYSDTGRFEQAEEEFKRAEELAPNNADILLFHGSYLAQLGDPNAAADMVDRALRLNPNFPFWYNRGLRVAYYFSGRFDQARAAAERAGCETANDCGWLAVTLAQLGRNDAASEAARRVLELDPDWSAERRMSDFGKFARDQERLLFADGARKAGLPVCATAAQLQQWPQMTRLLGCEQERAQQ